MPFAHEAKWHEYETIAAGASRGLLCVDFSTIDQATSVNISNRLAASGIQYLDAPVSGGPSAAVKGTLSVMLGGTQAAFGHGALQLLGRRDFRGAEMRSRQLECFVCICETVRWDAPMVGTTGAEPRIPPAHAG